MDKKELLIIKSNLQHFEQTEKQEREQLRKKTLGEVKRILRRYFVAYPGTRVYIFGSLISPGDFYNASDVDIAVENHPESRIDLYVSLSAQISYPIDIVLLEKCTFADDIKARGMLVSPGRLGHLATPEA